MISYKTLIKQNNIVRSDAINPDYEMHALNVKSLKERKRTKLLFFLFRKIIELNSQIQYYLYDHLSIDCPD